jgi:hypothetical protein
VRDVSKKVVGRLHGFVHVLFDGIKGGMSGERRYINPPALLIACFFITHLFCSVLQKKNERR